jgi:hypothetical protein
MFVMPAGIIKILEATERLLKSLGPLIHPSEVHIIRQENHYDVSREIIQKEYASIHDNKHIHKFLRKKYRPNISNILKIEASKYYFYTLFREKKVILFLKKILKNIAKVITFALVIVVFVTLV